MRKRKKLGGGSLVFFVVEAFGLCFDRGTWVFGGGRGVFLDGRWVCVVKEKVVCVWWWQWCL